MLVILYLFSFMIISGGFIHDLPSYITKCHRSDPEINQCLVRATEQIKPYLIKGIPELGIVSIDPLTVSEISLNQERDSSLTFNTFLKNITVRGLGNYKFNQFDFDAPNLQWFCKGKVEPIHLSGEYKLKGRILVAPIDGGGIFTASIENCDVNAYHKMKLITKKGIEYLSPIVLNTSIEIDGTKIELKGLYGNDEKLNAVINKVINDNVQSLFQMLKPSIEKVIANILENVLLKSLVNNIAFAKLFP